MLLRSILSLSFVSLALLGTIACQDSECGDGSRCTETGSNLPPTGFPTGMSATGLETGDEDEDEDEETSEDGVFDIGNDDDDGGGGNGDASCPCGNNADLIYVLSDSAELYTYDPQSNQFNQLGSFTCPGASFGGTFSMGVARDGTAWVMFQDADIYHVDVNNANSCTDPGYTPGQNGFNLFGMAFASQSAQNLCDTLYTHSFDGGTFGESPGAGRLGRLDNNLTPQVIGTIDYNGGELTGTGDGRLFAFAGAPNAKLIEYDKVSGATLETISLNLQLTNAFAFGFWGGDFYFFTEANGGLGGNSQVTKLDYDGSDGNGQALTVVNSNAPIRIVGAGVSTCAPTQPVG